MIFAATSEAVQEKQPVATCDEDEDGDDDDDGDDAAGEAAASEPLARLSSMHC